MAFLLFTAYLFTLTGLTADNSRGLLSAGQTDKNRRKQLKRLFESYQKLLTDIEERIAFISREMKNTNSGQSLRELRDRRELLREEYDDLIFAMHKMAKYTDERKKPSIRREVKGA